MGPGRRPGCPSLASLFVTAVLLAAPAPASAVEAGLEGGRLSVRDNAGVTAHTNVLFDGAADEFVVLDLGSTSTAGPGCAAGADPLNPSGNAVRCPRAGVRRIVVSLGAGDDFFSNGGSLHVPRTVPTIVFGGPGDDSVVGSPARETLDGGPGADILEGRGNVDTMTYASRTTPVRAAFFIFGGSGGAMDGPRGSRDTIRGDVERIVGGRAGDRLIGNLRRNLLVGGAGGDVIVARGGNDRLVGGAGRDRLFGGAGRDSLRGLAGRPDRCFGGAGRDVRRAPGCEIRRSIP